MAKLEDIVKIKNPLIMGETINVNIQIFNGYCRENHKKKCDGCKNFDAFKNKQCQRNGRL